MARINKLTNLVFSDIINTKNNTNEINKYLNTDSDLNLLNNELVNNYKSIYLDIINKIKPELETLANLEECITQLRCLDYQPKNFNLSITGNFIYAKCLFYRKNHKVKDIRIIAGNTSQYGNDLKPLYYDQNFINIIKEKIKSAMIKEINLSLKKLENLYIYM